MRKKAITITILLAALLLAAYYFLPRFSSIHFTSVAPAKNAKLVNLQEMKIKSKAEELKVFCHQYKYNTKVGFIVDMSQNSGLARFYVVDFTKDTILKKGLVAHGSCNEMYLENAAFNNKIGCGCSAYGKYKVSYAYNGRFGKAFKLNGLDSSNKNAFERNIVLHAYDCVPNKETYPQPICNSLGCPMVSYNFLDYLKTHINATKQPIILWMLNK